MKVILKEDIKNLGSMGSIVDVNDGYGRNYLIPRNLVVEANPKNIKKFEHDKKMIFEKVKKAKKTVDELAGRFSGLTLTIEANAGEDDKLFGSVTTMDIAAALAKQGFDIDKRKIIMQDDPIKRVGSYNANIKLHPDVTVSVNVEVRPVKKVLSPDGV
jgi:large subunit ribosomal protein L9